MDATQSRIQPPKTRIQLSANNLRMIARPGTHEPVSRLPESFKEFYEDRILRPRAPFPVRSSYVIALPCTQLAMANLK